jgi:cytochrome c oxidase assembly protein subunit 15
VWAFLAVAVVVLRQLARGDADPATLGRGRVLVGLVVAQGGLGYLQYFAGVPEILVGAHVLGSVLVWVAVLQLHLSLTEPVPATAAPDHRPAAPVPALP